MPISPNTINAATMPSTIYTMVIVSSESDTAAAGADVDVEFDDDDSVNEMLFEVDDCKVDAVIVDVIFVCVGGTVGSCIVDT